METTSKSNSHKQRRSCSADPTSSWGSRSQCVLVRPGLPAANHWKKKMAKAPRIHDRTLLANTRVAGGSHLQPDSAYDHRSIIKRVRGRKQLPGTEICNRWAPERKHRSCIQHARYQRQLLPPSLRLPCAPS